MYFRSTIVPTCLATLMLIASDVRAAGPIPDLPTVTKAFDIIDSYPERVPVGTVITFKKRNLALASRIVEKGVQARIFPLDDQQTFPMPLDILDDDGCARFISIVVPLRKGGGDSLVLLQVDEGWLKPTDSGLNIKEGRYYIVFERAGSMRSPFRLLALDTPHYFGAGFLLVVVDNDTANLQRVKDLYEKRKDRLHEIRREIDDPSKEVPCYKYPKYAEGGDSTQASETALVACHPAPLPSVDVASQG